MRNTLLLGAMIGAMFAAGCTGGAGGPTTGSGTTTSTSTTTETSTATSTATATSTSTSTADPTPAAQEEQMFHKIRDIVAREVSMKPELLTRQSRFVEDLKADDLAKVHIHLAFEQAFDRDIPDADFDKMKTLKDATAYMLTESKTPAPSSELRNAE